MWFFGLSLAGRFIGKLDRSCKVILYLNKISALICGGLPYILFFRYSQKNYPAILPGIFQIYIKRGWRLKVLREPIYIVMDKYEQNMKERLIV